MLIVSLPLVLGALLYGASVLSDGNRIPGLLAVFAKESGVMYCTEGKIVHGDGSLLDRAARGGHLPLHRLEVARRAELHGQGRHALADLAATLSPRGAHRAGHSFSLRPQVAPCAST